MDSRDSKRQGEFWAAYRRCAEENRVPPDRSQYYLRWVKEFVEFIPEKRLKARSGKDIEAFLAALGQQEGIAHWQVRQAEHALRILYETFLPHYSVTAPCFAGPANQASSRGAVAKTERFRDHVIRTVQELLGHANVATTMIYTHVLNRPGLSVKSPADL